ncbi:MAG: hypothetical protein IJ634_01130 [Bacteroidales bacterium]|nr:hypothetical protein [Bacteroidales bacterium]
MANKIIVQTNDTTVLVSQIGELIAEARKRVAVQVNTTLLATYWHIGQLIVDYEQNSQQRAEYGKQTLREVSRQLTREYGKGFSRSNLQWMRLLYIKYPICQTLSSKLSWSHYYRKQMCRPEEKDVMVEVAEVERRASSLALPRWSNVAEGKVVVNLINKNNQ